MRRFRVPQSGVAGLLIAGAVGLGMNVPVAASSPPEATTTAAAAKKSCKKSSAKASKQGKKCKKKKADPPTLTFVERSPWNLGNIAYESEPQAGGLAVDVYVVNSGTGPTGIVGSTFTSPTGGFRISFDDCTGHPLVFSKQDLFCTVQLIFRPDAPNKDYSATLQLTAAPGGTITMVFLAHSTPEIFSLPAGRLGLATP